VTDNNHSNDGLTPSVWEVSATNATSIASWVIPHSLPSESLNSQLIRALALGRRTLVLSVSFRAKLLLLCIFKSIDIFELSLICIK
jgi:hypothetical protein